MFRKKLRAYDDFTSLCDVKRVPRKKVIKQIKELSDDGWGGQNALLLDIREPIVYMIPHNEGKPTCPFVWYQRENGGYVEILNNQEDFTQIKNLNQILYGITDVMVESYEKKSPVWPLDNFGILLVDEIQPDYSGEGKLVLITSGNESLFKKNANKDPVIVSQFVANIYLDVFIGWNYGDVVRSNKELEEKLFGFNQRLINEGARWDKHPTGLEVSLRAYKDGRVVDQHYKFPLK